MMENRKFALLTGICLLVMGLAMVGASQIIDIHNRSLEESDVVGIVLVYFSAIPCALYVTVFLLLNRKFSPKKTNNGIFVNLLIFISLFLSHFLIFLLLLFFVFIISYVIIIFFWAHVIELSGIYAGNGIGKEQLSYYIIILLPAPVLMGVIYGVPTHLFAKKMAGLSFLDPAMRQYFWAHLIGFSLASCIVFVGTMHVFVDKWVFRHLAEGVDISDFVNVGWPIYVVAPAVHLIGLWIARSRTG